MRAFAQVASLTREAPRRSRQVVKQQIEWALQTDTHTRQAIRWLHSEMSRILLDHHCERCHRHQQRQPTPWCARTTSVVGYGGKACKSPPEDATDVSTVCLGSVECATSGKEHVAARLKQNQSRQGAPKPRVLGSKAHLSQHCRFQMSQETYRQCRAAHTSPQMLRAWVRLAQAVFTLPAPPLHRRSLLRAVNRLQVARLQPPAGWGAEQACSSRLTSRQCRMSGGRRRLAWAHHWSWWCNAHAECLSRRARKEAVHSAASAWSGKRDLARAVGPSRRVSRLSLDRRCPFAFSPALLASISPCARQQACRRHVGF